MFWKKFLSRTWIGAAVFVILAIAETIHPGITAHIDWKIVGPVIAYILGEKMLDAVRAYIEWTQPKG